MNISSLGLNLMENTGIVICKMSDNNMIVLIITNDFPMILGALVLETVKIGAL